jgi:hypothetical protein
MHPAPTQKPLGSHERLLPKAETAGRQTVHSWITYGPKQLNHFEPEAFPTGPLQDVAGGVLQAMLHGGVKDLAGLVAYFTDAPDGTRAELIECTQEFAPMPSDCGPVIAKLHEYDRALRKEKLSRRLSDALANDDETAAIVTQLGEIEAEAGGDSRKESLRERAYGMRFDPNETPPPDETCMVIGDIPIAARGNLTVPQGKSKVGKSAMISAILGAVHRGNLSATGDTLCVAWHGESVGAIIHLDTEQSRADWHALVCRGITRSGIPQASPRLVSLPLVMFSRSERLAILKQTLAFEMAEKGIIDLVLIDGVADLCVSPNDEGEALELVSQLHALAQEFHCPIVCVLHENPASDQGKTRGHLGSELNRKAFANLRIDKDTETSVSTIYGTDMRKRDIPKEQGFCFAWNDEAGMHTFQGRAAGLKAAQREEKATAEAREYWTPIFEHLAGNRENQAFPAISANLAVQAEREISGKEKLTNIETMKKRLQKGESLGVLRKSAPGEWTFIHAGKSGKEREK